MDPDIATCVHSETKNKKNKNKNKEYLLLCVLAELSSCKTAAVLRKEESWML
jgi:hypothetical protein